MMIVGLSVCIVCIMIVAGIILIIITREKIKKEGWDYNNEQHITINPPPPKCKSAEVYEAPEFSLNMIRNFNGLPEIKKRYYIKQFYTMQELIDYLNRDKIKNEDIIKIEKEDKMWTLICQK